MSGTIKITFVGILRTEILFETSRGMSNDPPQEEPSFLSFMFNQSGKTACYNEAGAKKAVAWLLLASQQRSQTVPQRAAREGSLGACKTHYRSTPKNQSLAFQVRDWA